jgi:phage shock protein B
MDGDIIIVPIVMGTLFIGLPWLILHHVTKWKTAATLSNDDERMLSEMHDMARRLEERMHTVERLVASENADWEPRRLDHEGDHYTAENIARLERNR